MGPPPSTGYIPVRLCLRRSDSFQESGLLEQGCSLQRGRKWTILALWVAYCFNEQGQWQGNEFNGNTEDAKDGFHLSASQFASAYPRPAPEPYLTLDDFPYPRIDSHKVSCGYTHVDVKRIDSSEVIFDTTFIAGSIGTRISIAKTENFLEGTRDTLQPIPGWQHFTKPSEPRAESESRNEHGVNGTRPTPPWGNHRA